MEDVKLWETALAQIQTDLSPAVFNTWFSGTSILSKEDGVIEIGCSTNFKKEYLEQRFQTLITEVLESLTKTQHRIKFSVLPSLKKPVFDTSLGEAPLFYNDELEEKRKQTRTAQINLKPDFTFETFAVSTSNQLAYAAAKAIVQSPGKAYNPLFLYGGVGVGKTHLMHAIAHDIFDLHDAFKIVSCTGEEFTNEIIQAIQTKTTKTFKDKYRSCNLLLVDDIQFIAGKTTVQEEFFHTFNAIQRNGNQIILTSDRPPHEIMKLEQRILSRFEAGMIVDIQQPDFELRTAILLIKAKGKEISLPLEVAKLVAANIESTRKLEGTLMRLLAESQIRNIPITLELASSLLGTIMTAPSLAKRATPQEIIKTVSDHYGVPAKQLKSGVRSRPIAVPRQILMYLLRTELNLPFMEIGALLGGRDHTTIMHGVEKITNLLSTSETMRADVLLIKQRFS
ncbi:MAG TPA: chromosomal replication initiator protein DnaA [Patescibacteria group bacterium]|nr:chromosomal replication initiator protein DnaA [Patescibacteria group bacterium]